MRRVELEHIIRAAGRIVDQDIVVVGSQAPLALVEGLPGSDALRKQVRAGIQALAL